MGTNENKPKVTTRQGSVTQVGPDPIFHLDGKKNKVKVIKIKRGK
jgi:hypothetical protein